MIAETELLSVNRVMVDIGYARVGRRRVMIEQRSVRAYIERRRVQPHGGDLSKESPR
jgi:hypothetical protein